MERRGRKPLATGHVDRLEGSALAKLRMATILKTLSGEWTIEEACRELGICESRFHILRREWLRESLELLEPRRIGRPPKANTEVRADHESADTHSELEHQLQVANARREITEILSVSEPGSSPSKKNGARRAR